MKVPTKYTKDGQTAVLVSPGYGAGWSTWGKEVGFLAMDATLVQMKLDGATSETAVAYALGATGETIYGGGWDDIKIQYLPEGTKFTILDYDGYETLETLESLGYTA